MRAFFASLTALSATLWLALAQPWLPERPPEVDLDAIQVEDGVLGCRLGRPTGPYVIDGIAYVDAYDLRFGWQGSGCPEDKNLAKVEVIYVPTLGEPARRLLLGVRDLASGEWLYGPPERRHADWRRRIETRDFPRRTGTDVFLWAAGLCGVAWAWRLRREQGS